MIDLSVGGERTGQPGTRPGEYWAQRTLAIEGLAGPVATIDVDALRYNAHDLMARSAGRTVRVASKSIRVRDVLDAVLRLPGYRGILAYTLAEALWLAKDHDDIVLGYPSIDRASLALLVSDERASHRITLMVDDVAQLDLIDSVAAPGHRSSVRIAIDADASWRSAAWGHVGVRRSPVHSPDAAVRLARAIVRRPGFRLVGLMMYEAQVAGQPDAVGLAAPFIRWMQRASMHELADRRRSIVAGVRAVTPLEFVNGGGTGSLERTAADPSVTETTAGSGLLAGHLFDGYRSFHPAPAAAFAYDVVRKPAPEYVTLLGGGWIASGPSVRSRQPAVVWPQGLSPVGREAAGEVQTPLHGPAARALRIGDRVWMRHAKSGEPAEHVMHYELTRGVQRVGQSLTYRGEGKAFL